MGRQLHPSTADVLEFFEYENLPKGLREVSKPFYDLAQCMAYDLVSTRGAEVTAGLRKLLEARDCFVRAALPRKA